MGTVSGNFSEVLQSGVDVTLLAYHLKCKDYEINSPRFCDVMHMKLHGK